MALPFIPPPSPPPRLDLSPIDPHYVDGTYDLSRNPRVGDIWRFTYNGGWIDYLLQSIEESNISGISGTVVQTSCGWANSCVNGTVSHLSLMRAAKDWRLAPFMPCAECDAPVWAEDYLCPACRSCE